MATQLDPTKDEAFVQRPDFFRSFKIPDLRRLAGLQPGREEIGADDGLNILTFPVKIENDKVLVELPAVAEIDAILGTHGLRVSQSECIDISGDAIKVPTKKQDWNQAFGQTQPASSTTALRATQGNSTTTEP